MSSERDARSFLIELKRRHVFQVGAAYVAVGLGVLGAAQVVLEPLGLAAALPFVVVLTLLGFPLALVLAWAYDLRPTEAPGVAAPAASPAAKAATTPAMVGPIRNDARDSIVVLPFANLSPEPENEYFTDGITEEIINALSSLPGLRVIARTSAFSFKGSNQDVREIAHRLGVGAVLEGSVRRSGERLRITAQLIDVAGGHHVWSERYDRELVDVFAIQDEIAHMIADRLHAGRERRTRDRPTESLEAYEAFLRGRFHYELGTTDSYARSIEHYERATSLDPAFAQAWAGEAEAWGFLAFLTKATERFPKGKTAATRAIELDDTLADAHGILGWIKFFGDWDWLGAIAAFDRAAELNPDAPRANQFAAGALANLDSDRAVVLGRRGVALDPLSALANQTLGWALYQAGDLAESMRYAERSLEIAPDFLLGHFTLGFSLLDTGQLDRAERTFRRMLEISPGDPRAEAGLVQVSCRSGSEHEARRRTSELEGIATRSSRDAGACAAWARGALGDLDEAFEWIERAIESHDAFMVCLPTFSWWEPLHADPRFVSILRRMNFPEWSSARLLSGGTLSRGRGRSG